MRDATAERFGSREARRPISIWTTAWKRRTTGLPGECTIASSITDRSILPSWMKTRRRSMPRRLRSLPLLTGIACPITGIFSHARRPFLYQSSTQTIRKTTKSSTSIPDQSFSKTISNIPAHFRFRDDSSSRCRLSYICLISTVDYNCRYFRQFIIAT
jgi:hypothetical protein